MGLTRDEILRAADCRPEPVSVPEWGGQVWIRPITAAERDRFEMRFHAAEGAGRYENLRAALVAMALADEEGRRLLADEDAAALGAKSAAVLDRLFDVAKHLAGIGPAEAQDLEKN